MSKFNETPKELSLTELRKLARSEDIPVQRFGPNRDTLGLEQGIEAARNGGRYTANTLRLLGLTARIEHVTPEPAEQIASVTPLEAAPSHPANTEYLGAQALHHPTRQQAHQ